MPTRSRRPDTSSARLAASVSATPGPAPQREAEFVRMTEFPVPGTRAEAHRADIRATLMRARAANPAHELTLVACRYVEGQGIEVIVRVHPRATQATYTHPAWVVHLSNYARDATPAKLY